jgi:hypothetical protein
MPHPGVPPGVPPLEPSGSVEPALLSDVEDPVVIGLALVVSLVGGSLVAVDVLPSAAVEPSVPSAGLPSSPQASARVESTRPRRARMDMGAMEARSHTRVDAPAAARRAWLARVACRRQPARIDA